MPTDQDIALSNRQRFHILFSLMFGIIMAPIDAIMVKVILPTLTEVLSAQIALAQWVPMIYLLIISSLLLFFGRLGHIWGYKKVFMRGIDRALLAGAVVAAIGAITSLVKPPAIAGKAWPRRQYFPPAARQLTFWE
jgi:MFS family permease